MTDDREGMKYYFPNKSKEEIAEMQRIIDECYANVIKDRDNVAKQPDEMIQDIMKTYKPVIDYLQDK